MIASLLGAITLMIAGYLIGSVRVIEEGDEGLVQRLGEMPFPQSLSWQPKNL